MFCLHVDICVPCVQLVPREDRKDVIYPLGSSNWIYRWLLTTTKVLVLGLEPGFSGR